MRDVRAKAANLILRRGVIPDGPPLGFQSCENTNCLKEIETKRLARQPLRQSFVDGRL
jgi:hypothetical protein